MNKHLFTRPVAACLAAVLALGCLGGPVSATTLSRDSGLYASADFQSQYTYGGSDLGAVWRAEGTTFRVWAPTATDVQVNLYRSGTAGTRDRIDPYPMTKDVNGTWVVTIDGDLNGLYYTYQMTVNGRTAEACDPYARSTGIDGQRAAILNLDATDPEGWEGDSNPHANAALTDAVIYELDLQGTKGGFAALTETAAGWIAPVKSLGATHVELPALYDCDAPNEREEDVAFGDGSDPVNFNAPEGAYATNAKNGSVRVKELKALIQTIHSYGLSVVMRVDYTHVADVSKFGFNQLVPGYFSRISQNGTISNGSGFGNDTATERSMVSKYIADSICYWAEEYHIDGFRLERLGLMDTDTINAVMEVVHAQHPDVLFYGDGKAMETTVTQDCTLATEDQGAAVPGMAYLGTSACVLDGAGLSAAQGLLGDNPVIIPTGVEMTAEFLDYWAGLLAFSNAKEDILGDNKDMLTLFNTEGEEREVTLPEGQWQIYVQNDVAGTEVLGTVEGTATLAPGTAMVLVKPRATQVETTQPGVTEPTEAPTDGTSETLLRWMRQLTDSMAPVLPYLDLIAAGMLMVVSGITIIVVLILKRKK